MAVKDPTPFAHLLNRYRLAHGLTQEELAERAGVSVRGVSDLERGIITKPRTYTVYQLAEALQLGPHDRALFEAAAYQWKILPGDRPHHQPDPITGSFLGALPEGALVGREEEKERIRQLLDAARGGTGQFLLLAGERGVGKTRLAQDVMVEAQQRGFLVLTARCHDPADEDPLTPIWQTVDALEQYDSRVGNTELVCRRQEILALAHLGESPRLFSSIGDLVLRQANISPLALLLDDVQRATPATIHLVDYLARSIRNAPVFLLVTYREAGLKDDNPVVAHTIQDLMRERVAERITLRRFLPEETAAVAAALMGQGPVSEEFVGFLHRRSKGNPRYIEDLVRSLGGRLELEREIGAGAMGRVFAAYDRKTDREVAAKLMLSRDEVPMEMLHSFQQEGAIMTSLHHPHIVAIYDSFMEEHASCIIMERVEGCSLRQVLEDAPLPLPRARKLALQVIAALEHAHQAQIVHRDIKPDNIMVTADDQVKVTDFGIARILKPDLTLRTIATTGMRVGTPLYMAPEQIRGKTVDARADVYALGAVLFHMVTGRPPFEGDDALAIAIEHLQDEPPRPSTLNPAVPPTWDAAIGKALAKDPAKRFQSAREMGQALRALDEQPRVREAGPGIPRMLAHFEHQMAGQLSRALSLALAVLVVVTLAVTHYVLPSPASSHVGNPSALRHPVLLTAFGTHLTVPFQSPDALAPGPNGTLYAWDSQVHSIVQLSASGQALAGWQPSSSNGSPGLDYSFAYGAPTEIASDSSGDVYLPVPGNNTIVKLSRRGRQLVTWGEYGLSGYQSWISGTAVDAAGNVYLADPAAGFVEQLSPTSKLLATWALHGLRVTSNTDWHIRIAPDGKVYVTDSTSGQIAVLSPEGKMLALWDRRTSHLGTPMDVAIDRAGNVYVADSGNHAVEKLSSTGTLLASWGRAGSPAGSFQSPSALVLDPQGDLYVADTGTERIQKLSPAGKSLAQWDTTTLGKRIFQSPQYIALDRTQNLYVSDAGTGRVIKLSPIGDVLARIGTDRGLGHLESPTGVAVDKSGNLFVADSIENRVVEFSPKEKPVMQWTLATSHLGPLEDPQGIAVDDRIPGRERIYVADEAHDRIVVLSPGGKAQAAWYGRLLPRGIQSLSEPQGIAVDDRGNVYVTDQLGVIREYSSTGQPGASFGQVENYSAGATPGQCCMFTGVAVDGHGTLYATDIMHQRVLAFAPSGKRLMAWGGKGTAPGSLLGPTGIAIGKDGAIYVVDTDNARVEKFSSLS